MSRILSLGLFVFGFASVGAAQTRDSTAQLATFQPLTYSPSWPFDYVPLRPTGSASGLPYLFLSNTFQWDTTNTKSINYLVNNAGTALGTDPCFVEMRATVLNLGVTNANCHVVYIPAFSGTFGSNNALQVNATSSYVRNASTQGIGKLNASGALDECRVITQGSQCWGNTIGATDTAGVNGVLRGVTVGITLQGTFSGYTGAMANPIAYEADMVQGGATFGSLGTAFEALKIGKGVWGNGFRTDDSAATVGLSLGALGVQASQNSQPVQLCYRNGSATGICGTMLQQDFLGNLNLCTGCAGATAPASTNVNNSVLFLNGGGLLGSQVALTCGSATTPAIDVRTGSYFTCNITGNVAVVIAVPGGNPAAGRTETIVVALRNGSGGALTTAPTFNAGAGGFKFAGGSIVNPGNGTQVLYTWVWDAVQSFWYLTAVSTAL